MSIRFENAYLKRWLAHKAPTKVFGKDVDHRERLKDAEAITWFDNVWKTKVEAVVEDASPCDPDFVRDKVAGSAIFPFDFFGAVNRREYPRGAGDATAN
jgi:hypothetical protein